MHSITLLEKKIYILDNIKPDIFHSTGHSVNTNPQTVQCLQHLCMPMRGGLCNTRLLAILVTLLFTAVHSAAPRLSLASTPSFLTIFVSEHTKKS